MQILHYQSKVFAPPPSKICISHPKGVIFNEISISVFFYLFIILNTSNFLKTLTLV